MSGPTSVALLTPERHQAAGACSEWRPAPPPRRRSMRRKRSISAAIEREDSSRTGRPISALVLVEFARPSTLPRSETPLTSTGRRHARAPRSPTPAPHPGRRRLSPEPSDVLLLDSANGPSLSTACAPLILTTVGGIGGFEAAGEQPTPPRDGPDCWSRRHRGRARACRRDPAAARRSLGARTAGTGSPVNASW